MSIGGIRTVTLIVLAVILPNYFDTLYLDSETVLLLGPSVISWPDSVSVVGYCLLMVLGLIVHAEHVLPSFFVIGSGVFQTECG